MMYQVSIKITSLHSVTLMYSQVSIKNKNKNPFIIIIMPLKIIRLN